MRKRGFPKVKFVKDAIIPHEEAFYHILNGVCEFTIENIESGNSYAYRVVKPLGYEYYLVKMLNRGEYIYIGTIHNQGFHIGKNLRLSNEDKGIIAFKYTFYKLLKRELSEKVVLTKTKRK